MLGVELGLLVDLVGRDPDPLGADLGELRGEPDRDGVVDGLRVGVGRMVVLVVLVEGCEVVRE